MLRYSSLIHVYVSEDSNLGGCSNAPIVQGFGFRGALRLEEPQLNNEQTCSCNYKVVPFGGVPI